MLKNQLVRTIIVSRVFLQLGIWVRNFAILLYVTDMTNNDPLYVSLISVAEFAPIFIFAVIGGTFADRWRPKRTMIGCDLLSALSILAVLLVLIYGSWHALFFATLVSAILSQFSQPSAMKLYKQHVPAEQLQSVMAIFQSLMAIFMVIGPIIGTLIYQRYGIEISIGVMGVMFLASALTLMMLPRDSAKSGNTASASFMKDLKDGLRYVAANQVLRTLGGTFIAIGLASGLIQPLMLFITIENLGLDKSYLQWLMMTNGAAMLVGGGLSMGVAKKVKPHIMLAMGLLASTVGTFGNGLSTSLPLTFMLLVLTGLFYPAIHIGISTLILRNSEEAYVGRVGGAITPLFTGMMVVGMSISGLLKDTLSLLTVFTMSSLLYLIGAVLLLPLFSRSVSENKERAKLG
ncbi:MFS transporter [Paenibacillus sp. RC67]|uniref:MFS transporter n=1 Tax=Paenibacillus sp. RC67 TaxID=3039392 RepID=UPI0024AD6A10|nr:MFS transporter [Paenibacillus sp. RC67]